MTDKIKVRPLGRFARFADVLMLPIMYIIAGTLNEAPQQTHRWNNTKLKPFQVRYLEDAKKVSCDRKKTAGTRFLFGIPLFHIPLLGGWKDYVVLHPHDTLKEWHIGWIAHDTAGVSRIAVRGPVRMLLGPGDVEFFGIENDGSQILIEEVARGRIGDNGPYAKVPLL